MHVKQQARVEPDRGGLPGKARLASAPALRPLCPNAAGAYRGLSALRPLCPNPAGAYQGPVWHLCLFPPWVPNLEGRRGITHHFPPLTRMFGHKHSPSGVASTEPQGGSAKCKLPGCGRSRAHLSGRPVALPAAVRLLGCSPDAWRLWDWPLASLGFQPCGRGEMPRCTVSTSACGSVACLPPGLPAGSRSTRAHGRDTQGRCLPGWAPWGLERAGAASAAPVIACARGLAAAARRRQEAPGRARAPAQGNRRAGGGHGGHPTRSAPRPCHSCRRLAEAARPRTLPDLARAAQYPPTPTCPDVSVPPAPLGGAGLPASPSVSLSRRARPPTGPDCSEAARPGQSDRRAPQPTGPRR